MKQFINEKSHINSLLNIVISNRNNCSFVSAIMSFLLYCSLHDYWPPSTWNSLVHTSWGEMERCEQRAFQLFKMRKKEIIWKMKTKCVQDIIDRSPSTKDYTCHYGVKTKRQTFTLISINIMRNLKYFFTCNRVFKHKEVVSNLHVCSNGLGKIWASYIFHFLQEF